MIPMKVPSFLARQFYVEGSLRNTPDGFALEAQNPMGDGVLIGVGPMSVDGKPIEREAVSARRDGNESEVRAVDLSTRNPIRVQKGDRVTLTVAGEQLTPGEHLLEVELIEINLGRLRFSISDRLADG
jgi:hypothetical protein